MEVRLQKVIAASGLASRRKSEQLIAQGRVTVNGQVIRELGTRVDPDQDHVKVDGRHLGPVEPHAYVILNKPKGYVSSLSDPEGRPTIKDLLHGVHVRVFPVGRLDFDTEGALLLTNHGEMAQALLHPRYHVPKVYLVKVKGVLTDEEIRQLEEGVELEDGRTNPAVVKKIKKAAENSWIELTIHEGRTHQVKRMLEVIGHPVLKLKRIKFGPLMLGDLPSGEFRYLTDREANALRSVLKSVDSDASQSASEPSPSTKTRHRPERPLALGPPRAGRDRHVAEGPRIPSRPVRPERLVAPYRPRTGGQGQLRAGQRVSGDTSSLSRRPAGPQRAVTPFRPRKDEDPRFSRHSRPPGPGRNPRLETRPFRSAPTPPKPARRGPVDAAQVRRSEGARSVGNTFTHPKRAPSPSQPRAGQDQRASRGTRFLPSTPAHPKRVSSPSRPQAGRDQLASRGTRFLPSTPVRPRGYRPGAPPGGTDRRSSRGPRSFSGRSRPPGRGKPSRSPNSSRPRGRRRP